MQDQVADTVGSDGSSKQASIRQDHRNPRILQGFELPFDLPVVRAAGVAFPLIGKEILAQRGSKPGANSASSPAGSSSSLFMLIIRLKAWNSVRHPLVVLPLAALITVDSCSSESCSATAAQGSNAAAAMAGEFTEGVDTVSTLEATEVELQLAAQASRPGFLS